jgi:hypothetical protein
MRADTLPRERQFSEKAALARNALKRISAVRRGDGDQDQTVD